MARLSLVGIELEEKKEDVDESTEVRRGQIALINDTIAQWIKPHMAVKYTAMKKKYNDLKAKHDELLNIS